MSGLFDAINLISGGSCDSKDKSTSEYSYPMRCVCDVKTQIDNWIWYRKQEVNVLHELAIARGYSYVTKNAISEIINNGCAFGYSDEVTSYITAIHRMFLAVDPDDGDIGLPKALSGALMENYNWLMNDSSKYKVDIDVGTSDDWIQTTLEVIRRLLFESPKLNAKLECATIIGNAMLMKTEGIMFCVRAKELPSYFKALKEEDFSRFEADCILRYNYADESITGLKSNREILRNVSLYAEAKSECFSRRDEARGFKDSAVGSVINFINHFGRVYHDSKTGALMQCTSGNYLNLAYHNFSECKDMPKGARTLSVTSKDSDELGCYVFCVGSDKDLNDVLLKYTYPKHNDYFLSRVLEYISTL